MLEGVQQAGRDWAAKNRSGDWLGHSAGRLEDAKRLRQREDFLRLLTPIDQAYLEACRAQENQRRERDLDQARKFAEEQRARADAERDRRLEATSRQFAAQAMALKQSHFDLAILLAVEANVAATTVEARGALLEILAYSPRLICFLEGITAPVEGTAGHADRVLARRQFSSRG
jgi:hypothetical protein